MASPSPVSFSYFRWLTDRVVSTPAAAKEAKQRSEGASRKTTLIKEEIVNGAKDILYPARVDEHQPTCGKIREIFRSLRLPEPHHCSAHAYGDPSSPYIRGAYYGPAVDVTFEKSQKPIEFRSIVHKRELESYEGSTIVRDCLRMHGEEERIYERRSFKDQ